MLVYLYPRNADYGTVVTHWPPTSEVCGSNTGPYVGKFVVAYQWLAGHSTEP